MKMIQTDQDTSPTRSSRRIYIATIVLLVFAVLLLVISVVENWKELPFLRQTVFTLDEGEDHVFASAGSGLAVASTRSIQLFSAQGKCAAREPVDFQIPACAACSQLGAYYDVGCEGVVVLYTNGSFRKLNTEGPVRLVDVNETGLLAVLSDKTGYQGCITVYDTDLSPLFRFDAGTSYPLAARLSSDDRLAVSFLSEEGSSVLLFRIDREKPSAEVSLPDEMIVDLGFLSDGTLALVTETELRLLEGDGSEAARVSFEGAHLEAWWLQGSFAALDTVSGLNGGSGRLVTLDSRGNILGKMDAPRDIRALSGAGEKLLVLFAGEESTLYTSSLEEDISYQPAADVRQVFLRGDNSAIFCGALRAVTVSFR